jgi:hypothetical protein
MSEFSSQLNSVHFLDGIIMYGVIDESAPFISDGQVIYTLALIVLNSADALAIQEDLVSLLNRKNPFHWAEEGPITKRKFITDVSSRNFRIHVCAAFTAQSKQEFARTELLRERLLPSADYDGVNELIIESRSPNQNSHDRAVINNWFREHKLKLPKISHVQKENALTWLADAASGVWSDVLMGRSDGSFETLANNRQLAHSWWQQS